MQGVF